MYQPNSHEYFCYTYSSRFTSFKNQILLAVSLNELQLRMLCLRCSINIYIKMLKWLDFAQLLPCGAVSFHNGWGIRTVLSMRKAYKIGFLLLSCRPLSLTDSPIALLQVPVSRILKTVDSGYKSRRRHKQPGQFSN